jgi:hypothetical protein
MLPRLPQLLVRSAQLIQQLIQQLQSALRHRQRS